jgi:hypothetical protein
MANYINLGSKVLFKIPVGAFTGKFKIALGTLQSHINCGGGGKFQANQHLCGGERCEDECDRCANQFICGIEICEIEYNGLIYSNRRGDIRKDTPKNREIFNKSGCPVTDYPN